MSRGHLCWGLKLCTLQDVLAGVDEGGLPMSCRAKELQQNPGVTFSSLLGLSKLVFQDLLPESLQILHGWYCTQICFWRRWGKINISY
ncbi:hypothetical protein FKM82_028660 [Ascaphus truei]